MATANFSLCICGKHGRITLANGYRGPEICDKEFGLHLVRTGRELERFSDDDTAVVMEKILRSPLPLNAAGVSQVLLFSREVLNHLAVECNEMGPEFEKYFQQLTPEHIHDLLHGKFKEKDVPKDFLAVITKYMSASKPQ